MSDSSVQKSSVELPSFAPKQSHVAQEWKYDAPLMGCRYTIDGDSVFAASMDFSIQRWNRGGESTPFEGHQSWLRGLGFSPDGETLYSAGYEGKLCYWDALAKGDAKNPVRPQKEIQAHQGWVRWLAVSPDGELIATAGNDLAIRLWSATSGELVQELEGHEKHIYSLLFHPEEHLLLSGDLEGVVRQWNLSDGALVRTFDAKPLHTYHGGQQVDYGGVRCMTFNSDRTQLACGGLHKATNPFAGVQEPLVLVFDWETGKQIRTHEATEIPRGIVWRLGFEKDGTLVSGVGGDAGYVVFWNEEKTDFHKLKLRSPILDFDRHPLEPEVVAACHDGNLRIIRMTAKA